MSQQPIPEAVPEPLAPAFESFGRLIRAERERLGITQTALAQDLVHGTDSGVSDSILRRWELGREPFPEGRLDALVAAFAAFARKPQAKGDWSQSHEEALRSSWRDAHKAHHAAKPGQRKPPRGKLTSVSAANQPFAAAQAFARHRRTELLAAPLYPQDARAGTLHDSFVSLSLRPRWADTQAQAAETCHSLPELLARHTLRPAWVLVGEPGAGKSTLLFELELAAAQAALQAWGASNAAKAGASAPTATPDVPRPELCVRLSLGDCEHGQRDVPEQIDDWVARWIDERFAAQVKVIPGAGGLTLEALARHTRVRLLLDGLNEIKARPRVRFALQQAFMRHAVQRADETQGAAPVFTVRRADHQRLATGKPDRDPAEVDVLPWEIEQIEAYCRKTEGLWQAVQQHPAHQALIGPDGLMRSPFYLRLQADLYRERGGRLSAVRAELLGLAAVRWLDDVLAPTKRLALPDELLGEADAAQVHQAAQPGDPQPLHRLDLSGALLRGLADLAWRLHLDKGPAAWPTFGQAEVAVTLSPPPGVARPPSDPVVQAMIGTALALRVLVRGSETGFRLKFAHQLWQEYFAACGLAARSPADWPKLDAPPLPEADATAWELPAPPVNDWEQTAQLAVQVADPGDAGRLLDHLSATNLPLAARAAASADLPALERAQGPRLAGLRRSLLDRCTDAAVPLPLRIEAGEALGALGDTIRYAQHTGPDGHRFLLPRQAWAPDGIGWIPVPAGEQVFMADEQTVKSIIAPDLRMAYAPVTVAEFRCFVEAGGYGAVDAAEAPPWWQGEAALRWWRGELANEGARSFWTTARQAWTDAKDAAGRDHVRHVWFSGQSGADFESTRRDRLDASDRALQLWLDSTFAGRRHRVPDWWYSPRHTHGTQPVVGISLFEAQAYCRWLSHQARQDGRCFRLPTEAEWAVLAQGGQERPWPWADGGSEQASTERMNYVGARVRRPTPVGVFPAGRSSEGAVDLAGNVWEWCASPIKRDDWSDVQGVDAEADPTDPAVARAVRGGSWYGGHVDCRPAVRGGFLPAFRNINLGFRVVSCPI